METRLSVLVFVVVGLGLLGVIKAEEEDITEVKIADFPYMVSIYYYRGYIIQRCTGTFITNRFILTSGVCFQKYFKNAHKSVAIIGSDRPNRDHEDTTKFIEIECGYLHPNFRGSEKPDDVAIMRLKTKVTKANHPVFGTACIPPFHNTCDNPKDCFAVLYDINEKGQVVLGQAQMEVLPPVDCKKDFGRINAQKQICAKKVTKKRANALLHSGSALICKVTTPEGKTVDAQFGIVNFDFDSILNKYAGVFINAPYYRDWMQEIVAKHKNKC